MRPDLNSLRGLIACALLLSLALVLGGCSTTRHMSLPPSAQMPTPGFDEAGDRPPTAHTLHAYARMLAAGGKDAQASTVLLRCVRDYATYSPAYVALADLHMRHRRLEEAVAVLELGLERIPDDPVLHSNLGICLLVQERYDEALEEFHTAVLLSPDDGRLRGNVALANALLGQYDEALAAYEEILPPGEAHYNLAVICEARGDHERAQQEYALAKAMDHRDNGRIKSR